MPYKSIKFLGIQFKIAEKGNWIKFSDKEINSFLTSAKITKDQLIKSHEIDQIKESEEKTKVIKIPALNRIEILGYVADSKASISSFKSVKDIKKLREKFLEIVQTDKDLQATLDENGDNQRAKILDEFLELEVKEVRDNSPVFNFKRILKFYLENNESKAPLKLDWRINKSKK